MGAEPSSIIFPFARGWPFAKLAVDSMARNSALKHTLLVGVEPIATDDDLQWIKTIPSTWPGPCEIYYHEKTRGPYGNTNFLTEKTKTPIAIWFTTDQVAGPNWDKHLLEYLKPGRFITGRLVEAGATLIGDRTIWKRFGLTAEKFDTKGFDNFCLKFAPPCPLDLPRHYIPMAFYVEDFTRLGKFQAPKEYLDVKAYRADLFFFFKLLDEGYNLLEAQKALTYHFQSGSKRTGMTPGGHLNWIYPWGLRWLHKKLTGYQPLIESLVSHGARKQLNDVLRQEGLMQ